MKYLLAILLLTGCYPSFKYTVKCKNTSFGPPEVIKAYMSEGTIVIWLNDGGRIEMRAEPSCVVTREKE